MSEYQPNSFIDKFVHALEVAPISRPEGGICGFELEWNLLNSEFNPLLTIGVGTNRKSFVDYLRMEILPSSILQQSQLEVFHWMIEWATKPYYHLQAAVYKSRLAEAVLINSLHRAGIKFGERLYYLPGNLLRNTQVNHNSIPGSWHIAKRRYLERCVDLYGNALATAGIHTNLSIPEPLLEWDFVHLSSTDHAYNGNTPIQLDDYKNSVYIRGARLLRAFASLFIATSAATPFQPVIQDEKHKVILTSHNSVRNLTFPNPITLDVPNLYRSYEDYLNKSYDLVRRGIRFGNNNWNPVRARSFAEPVERLIAITSDQLQDLYAHGLYTEDQTNQVEDIAKQIEIQNLLARINIPMARVEIRTDEGGHSFEIDLANLTLKYLLFLRCYADKEFARNFRYDEEDIERARRNELMSARYGLRAEIENPLTGKPVQTREFLGWVINEVKPLATGLELWKNLMPLVDMSKGAPNTAEKLRNRLSSKIKVDDEVPVEILQELAIEREFDVLHDVEMIASTFSRLGSEAGKINRLIHKAPRRIQPRC